MTDFELKVMNNLTIETIIKGIVDETSKWDFKTADYITLTNALLDLSLNKPINNIQPLEPKEKISLEKLNLPLTGEHIKIIAFNKETDFGYTSKWLDDEVGRWFLLSRSYTRDTSFKELIDDERNIIGLITLHDSTPIGLMGYLDYDKIHNKAEMRKLIGEEVHRGKGYAKEATTLWIQYGINSLGLKKIFLNTIENNIRNVTLNKELGFQVEGILRKECFIDNKYYDLLRMALIAE
jgi:RimJ/RimL family protein N-acetyltransferase